VFNDEEIREILRRAVEYEENPEKIKFWSEFNLPVNWEWSDIQANPQKLYRMALKGVLKIVYGGRRKSYCLADRELTKKVLSEYELIKIQPLTFEKEKEIPKDLFDVIVGYEDVKKLFKMSIEAEKPTHILLVGPPASSKTVFLLEINRLPNAFYLLGGSTTKVGLIDQLFALRPNYVLLDEIDKMNPEDYTALLSLMETGIVKEVKHGKTREIILKTKVYAACNSLKNIPPELLSRFQFKLQFRPYTEEEFLKVSRNVLIKRENLSEDLAEYISRKVSKISRDVRDCIGIARLAKTKEDVDFLCEIKSKYRVKD